MLVHEQLKIYRVRLPMPYELNHINCYAIKGSSGWSLLDTGLNQARSISVWQDFMQIHDIKPGDIKNVYVTHAHPDHFELGLWFQKLSGAAVYMSAEESEAYDRFRIGTYTGQFSDLLLKNSIPPALLPEMDSFMNPGRVPRENLPALTLLAHGDKVWIGDFEYSVLLTPGHTDGHGSYFNEEFGVLFSGDNILSEISPNISLWYWTNPNPVKDYLNSLEMCAGLPCKLVLGAHGDPISNSNERISVLQDIHREKLAVIKSAVAQETTVYQVVLEIYGKTLDMLNLSLAMGEVYAHLMFLYYKGEMQMLERDGKYYFRVAD